MEKIEHINVIGAGLAGCEAAYQAAIRGVKVRLYEMKPKKFTPAHHSPKFAELVCSNSLRSDELSNAIGVLKAELRALNSIVMEAADNTRVPAGSALAVDREQFSSYITEKVMKHPNITVINEEISQIDPNEITVIATGPLTSDSLSNYISDTLGLEGLHFFDAAAPIVDFDSIDMNKAFFASRYNKGDADYINCPMNEDEYKAFYNALVDAKKAELHEFDKESQKLTVFEGCMPVEVMAKRGYDTLLFGPLKPVGIEHPVTKETYHAVVQLRKENASGTMYNIVGFQTHLTFGEQKRVFSLIPGLENATFLRYGVMHRNTYLDSPKYLTHFYSLKKNSNIYFAGQMTGVEGYIESASSGFVAGVNASRRARGLEELDFTDKSVIGALSHFVNNGGFSGNFQPMNANFGIVAPLEYKVKGGKKARNEEIAKRALSTINELKGEILK
ncbi:MAG: methylenetetrahydrofolate--tRNA-(uracil(54)-C(5))-methyltransferase (FADH(2)-oxidizing) TrmFO [Ruminococcaceae bacterium]|nr:methylenetetrahydrofolate--tRNA-(uracil(54)-C(5))-methyltransferase (FADH(2)-oxidizing) TrmFO [Oscillospiraceae bacterium]